MLNNFRNLNSLLWSQGTKWLLFRIGYALRRHTGYLRMQMPQYNWNDRPLATWLKKDIPSTPDSYFEWRKKNAPKFFIGNHHAERSPSESEGVDEEWRVSSDRPWNPQIAIDEADRLLKGELKYFSHTYHQIGFPPDWHRDPVSGKRLDSKKHWSEFSDDTDVDLKFIWEASRFGVVYILVRAYASSRDEKYAEAFWDLIQSWAESNPPNTGPNWMDGQEAALRLMAWVFGYHQFSNSPSSTSERVSQFTLMVAAHAERIYKNIDFAIFTQGNHAVSEASGLWMIGLLFPELKDAEKYSQLGAKLLEQHAVAQIFPDGTYSMYSLNYHRFVLHLYLYAIRLGELNQSPISSLIFDRVSSSIDYLYHLIDPQSGRMPVYGSNDGALVLPLNNCDFTDYRPLLQLGSYVTKKQLLFEPGPWDEDIFWLYGAHPLTPDSLSPKPLSPAPPSPKPLSLSPSFPHGGTYLLHSSNSRSILRCTDHRARPSHADQLHVDLWMRGHNVAVDAGTYLYSGEGLWRNGLARTAVHNTVTVDHQDQMEMLTRFTWTNWSHGKVLRHEQNLWQGEHDGYKRLPDPVNHRRTVLALGRDRWLVVDHLIAKEQHHYVLHWLLNDFPFEQREKSLLLTIDSTKYQLQFGFAQGSGNFSVVRADPNSTRGWRSQYYGEKEPAISVVLETDQSSTTFWSFFGFEEDVLQSTGKILKINSQEIDLTQLTK